MAISIPTPESRHREENRRIPQNITVIYIKIHNRNKKASISWITMPQLKEKTGRIEKPETAAPREGFMGKSPLVGALLSPDDPIMRIRSERQASASSLILDVVNEAVDAKRAYLEYGRLLVREATRIANTEKEVAKGAMISDYARPANKKEALTIALSRLAPGSSITDEKPSRMDASEASCPCVSL